MLDLGAEFEPLPFVCGNGRPLQIDKRARR
jgi:hypothetical protein